jgi:hypothetical protein
MMDHHQNVHYAAMRQQELLKEAERQHLADEVDEKPFYAPVLSTVGHKLVEWGQALEERYGTTSTPLPEVAPKLV